MHILITGPESSGKTVLADRLGHALDAFVLPEFARSYLNEREGKYGEEDLLKIWRGQMSQLRQAPSVPLYVHDTGPFVLAVWSAVKYGRVHPEIMDACRQVPYDLILLCAPDLDWTPDPLREAPDPDERWHLFMHYRALLEKMDRKYVMIRGEHRLEQAMEAYERSTS